MSAGPGVSSGAYTPEEALIVNQALRTHRDTTAAAERALKVCGQRGRRGDGQFGAGAVALSRSALSPFALPLHPPISPQTANRTKEVAAATLEDLERQGDQLGRVRGDLNTVSVERGGAGVPEGDADALLKP